MVCFLMTDGCNKRRKEKKEAVLLQQHGMHRIRMLATTHTKHWCYFTYKI